MRLADRFCRFGTMKKTRVKRRPIVTENNAADTLAFAALNSYVSSRQMEKKSGISQRFVLRISHRHKFHPYCMSLHQDLYGNDFLKRVNFCNWILRKMPTDVSFLSHVIFPNEANLANTGNVNRHNMHYWANENPRWMRNVPFQHPWSVNCWCSIVGDHVIAPHFFEGRLTEQVFVNFLQNVMLQLMDDAPLHVRMNMWMQHDGAPPHYSLCSRQVMNEIFDEKWIGRGGPVAWPPRSLDLTSPDYFSWDFVK